MHRRKYLEDLIAMGLIGATGCLGTDAQPQPTTHLEDPDPQIASEDKAYPAWGEQLPAVTLPAAIQDEHVDPTGFTERDVFMTFFYSHCGTVCPRLVAALRNIQTQAASDGFDDDVVFLAVTFDPVRDTPARLREYADLMNVDLAAGNWYFLRPESQERAKEVVQDTYGVGFKKSTPEQMEQYMFDHLGLILLANTRNYVERAYMTTNPTWQEIYDEFETLRRQET